MNRKLRFMKNILAEISRSLSLLRRNMWRKSGNFYKQTLVWMWKF